MWNYSWTIKLIFWQNILWNSGAHYTFMSIILNKIWYLMTRNIAIMIIRYRNNIIILKHCTLKLIFKLIVDYVELISKIYIYFHFNWIREMKNHSIFIVKYLFKLSMTCFIFERNEIKGLGGNSSKWQWGSVNHQMAVPVPSISCCILTIMIFFTKSRMS